MLGNDLDVNFDFHVFIVLCTFILGLRAVYARKRNKKQSDGLKFRYDVETNQHFIDFPEGSFFDHLAYKRNPSLKNEASQVSTYTITFSINDEMDATYLKLNSGNKIINKRKSDLQFDLFIRRSLLMLFGSTFKKIVKNNDPEHCRLHINKSTHGEAHHHFLLELDSINDEMMIQDIISHLENLKININNKDATHFKRLNPTVNIAELADIKIFSRKLNINSIPPRIQGHYKKVESIRAKPESCPYQLTAYDLSYASQKCIDYDKTHHIPCHKRAETATVEVIFPSGQQPARLSNH